MSDMSGIAQLALIPLSATYGVFMGWSVAYFITTTIGVMEPEFFITVGVLTGLGRGIGGLDILGMRYRGNCHRNWSKDLFSTLKEFLLVAVFITFECLLQVGLITAIGGFAAIYGFKTFGWLFGIFTGITGTTLGILSADYLLDKLRDVLYHEFSRPPGEN